MAHTVARVTQGGLPYKVIGADRVTLTDVTVSTNSEAVTARELGLNTVHLAEPKIQTGQSTDTGTYVNATISANGGTVTVAEFAADGTAATTAASTVVRVRAHGR